MRKINTKETVRDIKVLDKAAIASSRMRKAAIRAKEKASSMTDDSSNSSEEYTQNKLQSGTENAGREITHFTATATGKAFQKGREIAANRSKKRQTASQAEPQVPEIEAKMQPRQPSKRCIKTARRTEKVPIKTSETAAKAAEKAAQSSKKNFQRMRAAAKKAEETAKAAAKGVSAAVKEIMKGIKSTITALAAGGSVAVIAVVVILLIALLVGSCFGIFFSSEEKCDGSERMCNVVREINAEFDTEIDRIKNSVSYDELILSGSHASWQDVLAVYAVKTTNATQNAMEVATVTDVKKDLLRDVFWDMTEISYETESVTTGTGDDAVTTVYLYITVSGKTADEMAENYAFESSQTEQLCELMDERYRPQWMSVLYGIEPNVGGSSDIVAVALSQIGNVGGEPYWSWYGYRSRVEWCACFVSWCANECGYLESGTMPKYAYCPYGVDWFQSHNQWLDGSETPEAGMIIFFDWEERGNSGPQDGIADHTGIVEKVEDGYVYTIEGNSADGCREREYAVGNPEILGYGTVV